MNIFELAVAVVITYSDKDRVGTEARLYESALKIIGDTFACWEADVGKPENSKKEFSR